MPIFFLTGNNTRRVVKVEDADIKSAVAQVCGWSEFEAYDLRKEFHDDGLGANLIMDLPLNVHQMYEIRQTSFVLEVE